MDWQSVKIAINKACREQKKDKEYTQKYTLYAKNLFDQNLPIISSPEHLAQLVGLDYEYVCRMAYSAKHFYRHYEIPKSNGLMRSIDEPLPDLKYVQHWILNNILEKIPISRYAKAFYKQRGVKENARFHKKQQVVLSMDVKDFFPSIHISQVVEIFRSLGYYDNLSMFLAYLCCLNSCLPQGAPTSPYLSNIRMKRFDARVSDYTNTQKIRYTRYADDLSFSGDFNPHSLIPHISDWLFQEGFRVNTTKTRIARRNTRQEVTGVVVNERMQIPKVERKKIRQEVYYIKRFGLQSHLDHIGETRKNYLNHLLGKINFALYINPQDAEMAEYFEYVKGLLIEQN